MIISRRRSLEISLVLLIIAAAVGRRFEYLTQRPFWVDEAESSINALTILEHGLPVDQYLGLPIYENTLVKSWPGNPEYEFKDISYSDRGLATYHGWLPLYSMAASFALNHVAPDSAGNGNPPHRTLQDFKRRTWIARLPSVFFSAVFLALCYWGGISLLGRDAGLTALLVGCVHQTQMDLSTTARYYSATVALSTGAVLCLWFILTKGQWKHYMIAAGAFTLLFYTHLVTFCAGMIVFCILAAYVTWRKRDSLQKLLVFAGLLALTTIPWMFATGFLSGLGEAPPARLLLSFPADLVTFPLGRPVYYCFFGAFLLATLATWSRRFRIPDSVKIPLRTCFPAVGLLLLWIVSGYLTFMLFIPAASFFPERINLSYWGPTLLLGSVFCAAVSRMFTKKFANVTALLLAFTLLACTGHDLRGEPSPDEHSWNDLAGLAAYLDRQEIPSTTKLFASPNEHLNLTFYTGRPFQSIAPVRKSFLDSYLGDIVYVERVAFCPQPRPKQEEQRLSDLLRTLPYRREINEDILGIPNASSNFLAAKFDAPIQDAPKHVLIPMLRGYEVKKINDWRTIFFYRFVNPASRGGRNTNYAERLRGSKADLATQLNWAIYYSKFHDSPVTSGVEFRTLP